jgi:hypothetical protein
MSFKFQKIIATSKHWEENVIQNQMIRGTKEKRAKTDDMKACYQELG